MKLFAVTALALAATLAVAGSSQAKPKPAPVPAATATFYGDNVAVGASYTWGTGVLTFKDKAYSFKVNGLSIVGLGVAKVTGKAEVYNLKSIEDFAGLYGAAGAGGAIIEAGGGTAVLRNEKGVTIRVHTQDKGGDVNVAAGGVLVTLSK